jgi:hypothetical protein
MRFGAVATITLLSAAGFVACFPNSPMNDPVTAPGGAGGDATTSSGGTSSTGGTSTSSGGATSSGDSRASGGAGGIASGGTTSVSPSGGAGGAASSGDSGGSGGASSEGGSGGSGGLGGSRATGGTTGLGGVRGSGGITMSAGGSSAAGTCTDIPPPNQTPTCAEWVSYNVCSQDWFKDYCNRSCGRCTGPGPTGSGGVISSGGAPSRGGAGGGAGGSNGQGGTSGGVSGPGSTNPPITGSNGFTTRYWDCCKPSCAWTTNVPSCQKDGSTRITDKNAKSGCEGGPAFECYDFSPWYDAATNMSYGFAAHNGVPCGACFMLQFTGEGNSGPNAGAAALKGQQMVVQAINIGGIDNAQFDLLIPGGGVGALNGCATQWGSSTDLGVQYGGLLSECGGDANCMKGKCQSVFGSMPALLAGCNWFTGWFSSADNPKVIYKQVSCPSQLTSKSGISG